MKLTKKLEAEILKAYNGCWTAYLEGDLKTHASFLSDQFKFIGTSEGEQFNNKKDWIAYCRKTVKQFAGVIQKRQKNARVSAIGDAAMVEENSDLYVLIDKKWTYYAKMRISAVLQKEKNGWKYIHQHGSLPDARANDGEVIAAKQIKKENLQLREAVKRRTTELENKNRELEIESALERVRAAALAMHKPEDLLNVCEVMYKELKTLGFDEIRNAMIHTFDKEDEFFLDYDYSGIVGGKISQIPTKGFPIIEYYLKEIKKGVDAFLEIVLTGEKLESWKKIRKATGQLEDRRIKSMKALYYYYYSIGPGDIGISTFSCISKEKMQILQRFRNVFQLSYQRYSDIEQAEAQAREARIEAALEKVRSRSLAMHKSDELKEVVAVVFERLTELGFRLDFGAANILIFHPGSRDHYQWIADPRQSYPRPFRISYSSHPIVADLIGAWEKGLDFVAKLYPHNEKKKYFSQLFQQDDWNQVPAEVKALILESKSYGYSAALEKNSGILVPTNVGQLASAGEIKILKRFAKVFEQSYVRFLDLQKAEAQAREAQIEASLEKVRASSMAMHHSSDLHNVVSAMTVQLSGLGLNFNTVSFTKINDDDSWEMWLFTPDQPYPVQIHVPYLNHGIFNGINDEAKKGKDLFADVWDKKEKNIFFRHFFKNTTAKNTPQKRKQYVYSCNGFARSNFLTKDIWFTVSKYEATPFSDRDNSILRRFASVFEQCYTRFMDLQKAEEQAREAKIEAALERVRSKAMAMHTSQQLKDVVLELRNQMGLLGQPELEVCAIHLYDESPDYFESWAAVPVVENQGQTIQVQVRFPKQGIEIVDEMMQHYRSGDNDYILVNHGKKILEWLEQLREKVPQGYELIMQNLGGTPPEKTTAYWSMADFKGGSLVMTTYVPPNEDARKILRRFANVFGLAYQRFADLKQAEAQARESQIQLALERVRARTMAMQRSDELAEAAGLLFQQVQSLGAPSWTAGYCIWDEDKKAITLWMSSPWGEDQPPFRAPLDENPTFIRYLEAHNKGLELYIEEESSEVAEENYRYLLTLPVVQEILKRIMKEGRPLPTYQVDHCAYFSKGFLLFITYQQVPELHDIFKRFAAVFDQTYTRFLDLQKAEVQAREAQIQLALERVRARTMAMHKSEELSETAQVVFQQLNELGAVPDRISIGIADEPNGLVNFWSTDQLGININYSFKARLDERTVMSKSYRAWKDHKKSLVIDLQGEELEQWIRYAREEIQIPVKEELIKGRRVHHFAYFSHGWLLVTTHEPQSAEMIQILERFASVFDLTYRRFLDLQKAEAQARESQIEAALERVRSRTMAMHRSEEITDIVGKIFAELKQLDLVLNRVLIWIFNNEKKYITWWSANPEADGAESYRVDYNDQPVFLEYLEAWQKRTPLHLYTLSGDNKAKWEDHLFTNTALSKLPAAVRQGMRTEGTIFTTSTISDYGLMMVGSFVPLSEQNTEIIQRFGRVFQQSYTRYLDVQKAEAQAREAKIEAALEKVRSRSLAMHKSEELQEVVHTLIERLRELNVELYTTVIVIFKEDSKDIEWWLENKMNNQYPRILLRYADVSYLKDLFEARESGIELFSKCYVGKEKYEQYKYLFEDTDFRQAPEAQKEFLLGNEFATIAVAFAKKTAIHITSYSKKNFSEPETDILKRFAKVFDQSYTRFLDLQKAEAQAREAQIEASLERVRAKAMAMHKSDDLHQAVATVFEELDKLKIGILRCGIAILDKEQPRGDIWITVKSEQGSQIQLSGAEPLDYHPLLQGAYDAWLKQEHFSYVLNAEELAAYYQAVKSVNFQRPISETFDAEIQDQVQFYYNAVFRDGSLFAFMEGGSNDEAMTVMKRFANVFDLTYKRFLDLQRAEAQAREARIEMALERIRARALAMHSSNELIEVTKVMREQMALLGQAELESTVVHLYEQDPDHILSWRTFRLDTDTRNEIVHGHMSIPKNSHVFVQEWLENFYSDLNDYTIGLSGTKQDEWYKILGTLAPDVVAAMEKDHSIHEKRYYHFSKFSGGTLLMISKQSPAEEAKYLLRRAAVVFDLAYRRFGDLQKTEAQAREAQIEAALERVRAKAMAMHQSQDLGETIRSFYQQLGSLQLMPRRCGVGLIDKETRVADLTGMVVSEHGETKEIAGQLNLLNHPVLVNVYENWLHQKEYQPILRGNEIRDYYRRIGAQISIENYPEDAVQYGYFFPFREGAVYAWTEKPFIEDELKIYRRFTSVLSLTYKRYKDLKQAEAQAWEARIEAGLERVRAMTMAMHNSEDVSLATATMFSELEKLNIQNYRGGIVNIRENETMEVWSTNTLEDGNIIRAVGDFDMTMHPYWQQLYKGWKNKDDFAYFHMIGKNKEDYIRLLDARRDYFPNGLQHLPDSHVQSYFFDEGAVWAFSLEPHSEENKQVMKKFAAVFSLTFRRYQDLRNAEAQAREARIEASLEKVRSKAMAMHNSQDLADTIGVFYREMQSFSLTPRRCGVGLLNKKDRIGELFTWNTTETGESLELVGRMNMEGHPVLVNVYEHWLTQTEYHPVLRGNEIKEYYQVLRPQIAFPDYHKDLVQFGYFFFFKEGGVYAWTENELSEDELQIYRRFKSVLSLTYKRYNDLRIAEANAREARIEAALEKVRSRSLAMHKSDELLDVIMVIAEQLQNLDFQFDNVSFGVNNEDFDINFWMAARNHPRPLLIHAPYLDNPVLNRIREAIKSHSDFFADHIGQADNNQWIQHLSDKAGRKFTDETREYLMSHHGYARSTVILKNIFFFIGNYLGVPYSDEDNAIFKRFANVFDQSYTRFLDLQKAEAQAREAKIEAAMEKVRARAMAMQKPGELVEVAELLRKEMGMLGVEELETSSIYIHDEATEMTQCWYAIQDVREGDRKFVSDHMTMNLNESWVGREMLRFYKSPEKQTSIVMKGDQRKEWINYCAQHSKILKGYYGDAIPDRTYHLFKFSNGYMGAASPGELSAESWELLKRATTVFSLAYTRFSDLQLAEASAKEAVKQAALDRVRAEIASMRTVDDLERITPLIWNELTILGIPFIRCGVFIMDEAQQTIHTFLSTPDGNAIAAFHLPYTTPGSIGLVIKHWHEKKIYVDQWDESNFVELAKILMQQGSITSEKQYLSSLPHGGFYLHFLPFLQGMLYVGNTTQLVDDDIKLIQHVADAFSTAYARYEDFIRLEAAKLQVEQTLADLKQAQTQLVQSEKMASLGELTAGIAHEIQNPLNFVNNFSDVSNELLQEMKEQLASGNSQEAMDLAEDVKQNLEKILHHGKRADAIVKGMLQHSRASSGQKELTDINLLADEYLRLAYHGLRAKDKSFNAKFETDFDPALEKVSVVPQEIGRVILNLINNAFYAVNEKKKHASTGSPGQAYEPTVTVATTKTNGKVSISVIDNGIGIPQKSLDKIFQPFFTTKPTSQGTGLGLSLAYDIVTKGHGGELKVDTKEGEGSEFIVLLPA